MRVMQTEIDYTLLGKVENELRNSKYAIKDIHYLENVTFDTYVEEDGKQAFTDWMIELTNGNVKLQKEYVVLRTRCYLRITHLSPSKINVVNYFPTNELTN